MQNKELRIGSNSKYKFDGGISYLNDITIGLNQSPYDGLLNMTIDDGGIPVKRKGQSYLFNSLGSGGIKGVYGNFKGYTLFAHGNKLYRQKDLESPQEIYSNYLGDTCFMFPYNSLLYIMNGKQFLKYDGNTVTDVEPYVPRVSMNRKPDGSESTVDESWNMLGNGFKDSFNGDGTSTVYKLSMKDLLSTTVTCNVGGTEGNGFTVDRVNGTVTFTTAPASGLNNVEIIAYKFFDKLKDNILNCTFGEEFSNRMFISGNSNLPNFYFASGLSENNDISYFPQKYQYAIKGDDKAVTGMKVHHNKLIVFKEDLTAMVTASVGLDNLSSYPVSFLNTEIGCDMPNSIQLIDNNVVFCNSTKGVQAIVSTMLENEKAIMPLSINVNGDLYRVGITGEDKDLLKNASSIDYDSKYILNIGDKCYVWDYKLGYTIGKQIDLKWFIWNNINAKCFFIKDKSLMYGHRNIGTIVKFSDILNDFGQPIHAKLSTKLIDFGAVDYYKTISYIWYTCRANTGSSVNISLFNDKGEAILTENVSSLLTSSFTWSDFSWDRFTWRVQIMPPTFRIKAKVKKARYFQFAISNNESNENLSIMDLSIQYAITRRVK